MKKMLFLMVLMLFILALSGCTAKKEAFAPFDSNMLSGFHAGTNKKIQGGEGLDGFEIAAENSALQLYYNAKTAETAVMDVKSGAVYRSNPASFPAGPLGAQLILTVYNEKGVRFTWDSNTQAVAYGQFRAEEIPGGLDVTYVFGQTEVVYAVPGAVKVDTFEKSILPMLQGTSGATFVKLLYSKVSLQTVDSPQQRQNLLERFPSLETMDLYVMKNNASRLEMEKAEKALKAAGYTAEQKLKDEADAGYAAQSAEQMHIRVRMRYALTKEGLQVTVPADEIAAGGGASVTDITVLPYFGSPGNERAGFALIPDGMGALIDLSTVREDTYPAYEARVYGRDYANLVTDSPAEGSQVYLPAFGLHNGSGALTAAALSGASYASVAADAPRAAGSPGYCAFKFLLQENTLYSLDAKPENRVNVFQEQANREALSIAYRFLPGKETTYSQMASSIRDAFVSNGMLPKEATDISSLPLVLKAVGAIDVTELILGIPVDVVRPLTTFEQMGQMAKELQTASGAASLTLVAAGSSAGGLRTTREMNFSPERKLGGEADLKKLQKEMQELGITLSVQLGGQEVMKDTWLDGFHTNPDTARLLTSAIAYKPEYTLSTMYQDTKGLSAYLLHLGAIRETVSSFLTSAKEKGVATFALSTLGRDLYSDFSRSRFTSREEMKKALAALVEEHQNAGAAFLAEGANSYLLPYLTLAYGLPIDASPHPLITEEVPLLQMVLSGHVPYAASDINYADDPETYYLKLAETGSGLYMTAFYEPGSAVKYTDFDGLYASSFGPSSNRAADVYRKAAEILRPVLNKEITCHERRGDVTRTGYEGGGAVYVNYGTQDILVDWYGEGFLLKARSAMYREEATACAAEN